jgi:hypothetical protein
LGAAEVVDGAAVGAVVATAGAVVAGVVVVPEQAVITTELINRIMNTTDNFFILSSSI